MTAALDPLPVGAVADLELVARMLASGVMHGVHQSRAIGAGLEFSQFRTYQPGDDLRRVDWKLYARSDRFYVREAEIESSVTIRLVLDASASMAHAEAGSSKLRHASVLLAACAWLARQQGDALSLYAVSDRGVTVVPPIRQPAQFQRIVHTLEQTQPGGRWPAWNALGGYFTSGTRRELVVVATDLHERTDEIRSALAHLAGLRHEVLLFHLLGPREIDLAFGHTVTLEDLETGQRAVVDPAIHGATYAGRIQAHLGAVRRDLEGRGVDYGVCRLDEAPLASLRTFLSRRSRRS